MKKKKLPSKKDVMEKCDKIPSVFRWAYKLCGKASSSTLARDLPDDIIIDILSRLPVKSLLRFKGVCNSWLIIISSSQFTKLHVRKIYNTNDYAKQIAVVILSKDHWQPSVVSIPLRSILLKPWYKVTWLDKPYNIDSPDFIIGSYNGLICFITKWYKIVLWNPTVGKYYCVIAKRNFNDHSYGFYYDENSDDYKIVVLCRLTQTSSVAEFWSSRTNSWKNIRDSPSAGIKSGLGVFVQGNLHWICFDNNTYIINALDLKSEIFLEILLNDINENLWGCPIVTVFKELLCVVCQFKHMEKIQIGIWVMKEYGVKESWTKLFVLPRIKCPWPWYDFKDRLLLKYTSRLCFVGNGELILLSKISFWHLVRRMSRLILLKGKNITIDDGSIFYFRVPTFVESLVSPCVGSLEQTLSKYLLRLN